jgi:hypothetical protein
MCEPIMFPALPIEPATSHLPPPRPTMKPLSLFERIRSGGTRCLNWSSKRRRPPATWKRVLTCWSWRKSKVQEAILGGDEVANGIGDGVEAGFLWLLWVRYVNDADTVMAICRVGVVV